MPTYEYRCPEGHTFELFQKMSDEPGADCPQCGAKSERILSGGAGFLLKGVGFYKTDYRSEDYKKAAAKESGETTAPGAASGKKPDGSGSKKAEDTAPKGSKDGGGSAPGSGSESSS